MIELFKDGEYCAWASVEHVQIAPDDNGKMILSIWYEKAEGYVFYYLEPGDKVYANRFLVWK